MAKGRQEADMINHFYYPGRNDKSLVLPGQIMEEALIPWSAGRQKAESIKFIFREEGDHWGH